MGTKATSKSSIPVSSLIVVAVIVDDEVGQELEMMKCSLLSDRGLLETVSKSSA